MTETQGTPAPVEPENATIRAMREQVENANKTAREEREAKAESDRRAAELEAKLKEVERSQLDETERLRLALADEQKKAAELEPLRDEVGKFASRFQELYEKELATVPDAQRPSVEKLTAGGSWADRYAAIQDAKALIQPGPIKAGTVTQPGGTPPAPADAPKPVWDPKQGAPGWGTALSNTVPVGKQEVIKE